MSSRQHYLLNANVNNIYEKLRMHFKIGWWANFFYAHTFVIMMMIFSACKFFGLLLKISEDDAPLPKHEYIVWTASFTQQLASISFAWCYLKKTPTYVIVRKFLTNTKIDALKVIYIWMNTSVSRNMIWIDKY